MFSAPPAPGVRTPTVNPWRGIVIVGIFLLGVIVGRYGLPERESAVETPEIVTTTEERREITLPAFWEAWDFLHSKYIGELDDRDLFYGAVEGMVRASGDPYTVFSDPETTKQFQQNIEGSFSGVGIEIGIRNGVVTVIAPLEGSPAQAAGVREGDIVVAVDEQPVTQEMTIDDVVSNIRGRRGTKVTLTVLHQDSRDTEDLEMVRETIRIESVKLAIEEGIAHLTITSFNSDTPARFTTAAREIVRSDVRGIILDVRNNPGGFLQGAVDVASRFLPEGTLVVTEKGDRQTDYSAEGNTLLQEIPLVVLVNEGSASASEILAGALSDQTGALLIGTKTFGKGSVQELVPLSDGSSLRVTVARWFTPRDQNIDEDGIAPDVEIDQNHDTDEDEPLVRAREELERLIGAGNE